MAITLGTYAFQDGRTAAAEEYEEIGGRDARRVQIKGVLEDVASLDALEEELDALLKAASEQGEHTALSLRTGRRLWVRRTGFSRELMPEALAARFTLDLEAQDPYEEAEEATVVPWTVTVWGDMKALDTSGNVWAPLVITLVATGTLVDPAFSDGVRTITYAGDVADGETLVFNGAARKVLLGDEDVTPYVTGLFPRIDPGGGTLTYTDDPADSPHTASVTVTHQARWW